MNDKDIDTRQLHDINLREAIARREQRHSTMPSDLNDRLMQRIEIRPSHTHTYWRWLLAAACIIFIIIGIGIVVQPSGRKEQAEETLAAVPRKAENHKQVPKQAIGQEENSIRLPEAPVQKHDQGKMVSHKTLQKDATDTLPVPDNDSAEEKQVALSQPENGQLIYASVETTEDSTYREPSLVDDFIAKFATNHGVRPVMLDCTEPSDTSATYTVYVFPDRKEVDVFGRLLQTACCYDNATPGYNLYISNIQLLFKMCDRRKGMKYLWLAERVGGSVLLYCSHSPINAIASSACYQEFRERFATQAIKSDHYHQL